MNKEKQEEAALQAGQLPSNFKDKKEKGLYPLDCAQLMTAFCRVQLFDFELMEHLERTFVRHIDLASGETLVTMFTSHAAWAAHMIE